MNANQIMNLILRLFVRKAVNAGIDLGINAAANRGPRKARKVDPQGLSEAERHQGHEARLMAKRARQTARATRRAARF